MNKRISQLGVLVLASVSTYAIAAGMQDADTDGDGFVSKAEFTVAHTARIEERFARMDTDADGLLSQQEIDAVRENMRGKHKRHGKKRMEARFTKLDADASGGLSRTELEESSRWDEERFLAADADGNGELTMDEIAAARKARKGDRGE